MTQLKRRLPLLHEPKSDGDATPPRPGWQWVGFGALVTFVVWIPLAWLAALLVLRFGPLQVSPAIGALPFVGSFVLAVFAGGYLVGRWGPSGIGMRQAMFAGLSAALAALALSWSLSAPSLASLVLLPLALPPAALGGRLGMKKRSGAW